MYAHCEMCNVLSNEGGSTMQVWQAALIGLLCYLGALTTPWALGTTGGWYVLTRPLVAGFLCGLILGDVKTGVLIGIAVQGVCIAILLLQIAPSARLLIWFLLGWVLVVYLKVPTVGVAVIGVLVALMYYWYFSRLETEPTQPQKAEA